MAVSVVHGSTIQTTEIIATNTGSASAANRTVTHTQYDISETLNSGSTPVATQIAAFLATLSSGALTISLAALTGTNGATIDGTGQRVQVVRITNLGANAMTIKKGASNGHDLFSTTDGYTITAGGFIHIKTNNVGTAIDSTHKNWDLTGTGAQTAQFTIILG